MIRYSNYSVVFQEFPGETTLAINLTCCPHKCPGCHSPWLWEGRDPGEALTDEVLESLIKKYGRHITCVGFMGGDNDTQRLLELARKVKEIKPNLRVGWYSGRSCWSDLLLDPFDYCKFGPYREELGGLDNPNTNQIMLRRINYEGGTQWLDITPYFYTHGFEDNFTHIIESLNSWNVYISTLTNSLAEQEINDMKIYISKHKKLKKLG